MNLYVQFMSILMLLCTIIKIIKINMFTVSTDSKTINIGEHVFIDWDELTNKESFFLVTNFVK